MAASFFSKVDEYGFERPDDFDYKSYEEFMSEYIAVLARRSRKWHDSYNRNQKWNRNVKLKRFIRKGIPSEFRAKVWLAVSGATDLQNNMSPDFYSNLLKEDMDPTLVETIKLDLPRTFPDNIFFKTMEHHQLMLFNVLAAYAHHNPKVGYCQGLNYIAGVLLLATKSEESSFWLLKVLVEQILEDYYSPSMEGVIVDIDVLSRLVSMKSPQIANLVASHGLPWGVITTKWFVCLFAEVLPLETVLRIWDCLFYEGSKMIFRVCLTLVKINSDLLLSSEDFSELAENFKMITQNAKVVSCHHFMNSVFTAPGSLSKSLIRHLRTELAEEHEKQRTKRRQGKQ